MAAGVLDLYIHMRSAYVVKDSNASMGRFRSEVSSDKTVLELDNPKAPYNKGGVNRSY